MNLLPKHEDAIIPLEKFTQYALDEDKSPDKAIAFRNALGYIPCNADSLIASIRHNLPYCEAKPNGNNGFGMRYEVVMNLQGPNGKNANVVNAWIIENGAICPRLTSAYVTNKKSR